MINLKNKNILVTGATGGIGNSIIETFSEMGANVLATGTNKEKLNSLKEKFENINIKQFDISNHIEIENFIEDVAKTLKGELDVVINNAGINRDNLTIRMSREEWDKVINLNLTSTFLICKYSLKKMIKNKEGKIINITSVVGHTGNFGQTNYSASKAGVVGMSKSLALEFARKNINVNCISPGFIETPMTAKLDQKVRDMLISKIPSSKLGLPKDVAYAAAFLSSDLSNYITGETLHVNGGLYLG